MRVFSHISEFGPQGMETLPALLTLSDRVSLWSPSASFIDAASAGGHSYLTPEDVLGLVDEGHVQIMGRHRWFFDRNLRDNHPGRYRFAAWEPSFDVALQTMAIEDDVLPAVDRRVLITADEEGADHAVVVVGSSDPQHRAERERAEAVMRGGMTRGLREKLDGVAPEDALAVVIRDIHNHRRAFEDSGADRVLIQAEDVAVYASAVADVPRRAEADEPDVDRLPDLLALFQGISRPRDGAALNAFLKRRDVKTVREEAGKLLVSGKPVDEELLRWILAGRREKTWRDVVVGRNVAEAFTRLGISAGGLVLALTHVELAAATMIALAIQVVAAAHPVLEKSGIVPVSAYPGPALPFILAHDRGSPTYREIDAMVRRIHELRGEN